jgi:hypothetical protein
MLFLPQIVHKIVWYHTSFSAQECIDEANESKKTADHIWAFFTAIDYFCNMEQGMIAYGILPDPAAKSSAKNVFSLRTAASVV